MLNLAFIKYITGLVHFFRIHIFETMQRFRLNATNLRINYCSVAITMGRLGFSATVGRSTAALGVSSAHGRSKNLSTAVVGCRSTDMPMAVALSTALGLSTAVGSLSTAGSTAVGLSTAGRPTAC